MGFERSGLGFLQGFLQGLWGFLKKSGSSTVPKLPGVLGIKTKNS